jgi:hypothetical protein
MPTDFDLPWILPYVRESLRGRGNFNFDGFADGVFAVLEKAGAGKGIEKRHPSMGYTGYAYNFEAADPEIRLAVTEAFYYLEQNRFILRPPPSNAPGFVSSSQCQITKRGQEWANSVEPLPEDYDGYMKLFDASTDPVVRQYISEALRTFIRGTFFASAVMIGAASEKAIYLLADSLLPTIKDATKRASLTKRIGDRKLDRLFQFIEDTTVNGLNSGAIPYSVMEGTTRHLLSLFEYIKVQRNDAIHPLNFQVSADSVRFSLNAFPLAFQKVEALRACVQVIILRFSNRISLLCGTV